MKCKLQTVNLEVADPERSKRFYMDALGMAENAERSQPPGFVYLESDGCHITLAAAENGAIPAPSRAIELGFEVDDLAALRSHFSDLGIRDFEPQSMGWGEVVEGRDRDGNRIIVYSFSR
jgi:catechol 2,3-dioxygenase-like lactoylglutathione lyase family enzyme